MLDLLDEWAVFGPKGKVREDAGRLLTAKLKVCLPAFLRLCCLVVLTCGLPAGETRV